MANQVITQIVLQSILLEILNGDKEQLRQLLSADTSAPPPIDELLGQSNLDAREFVKEWEKYLVVLFEVRHECLALLNAKNPEKS